MAYISRCRELRDKLLRCGGSISEDAFITLIIGGLGPQWRSTRAILRAHGKISEAALCAKIHAEQQDMDLQEERHKKKASVPETNVILQMSKVLIAEGLGYNLLSVSQLMAKGIHLEADSTTQEFKLFHGRGGLYIGKAALKNNVFVLDFVPDLGTADSDRIVTFTSWTHPPDLDPDFSPEGFFYSHTIPEAEQTRALATIQHSTAAETTAAAAETTATPTTLTTPVASSSTTSTHIDNTSPTPAQQLTPISREVHRSANFTAAFYSNSDLYRRTPGHRASEDIWHARMGHPSNTVLNNTIRASVLDKDSLLLTDGKVNTNEAERVGPNFIPDPEASDEAAYPEDTTLPRYTQSGLQLLGLVTAVHGTDTPREPATVQQALGGGHREKWHEAMDKELKALQERNTWKVVPIGVARNKAKLTRKWVFRVKTKADGTIDKFKARWVVRGFDQEHGRDFTETFAPVSRHTSLRILLAVAAMKKKKLRQIDVANAFLYAPVDAEIFVELPRCSHGEPNQVCQLLKSLYGIKQAPRLWQQYLHAQLTRIGFRQLPHDQGMYRLMKCNDYILLIVYVDDLLYIGSTDNVTTWFEGELQRDLTLTVSSTITQYLGLNIQEGEDAIYLNAAKYADTIAK
ncbi:unnamed protein product [Closterium sp. NIES-53]